MADINTRNFFMVSIKRWPTPKVRLTYCRTTELKAMDIYSYIWVRLLTIYGYFHITILYWQLTRISSHLGVQKLLNINSRPIRMVYCPVLSLRVNSTYMGRKRKWISQVERVLSVQWGMQWHLIKKIHFFSSKEIGW